MLQFYPEEAPDGVVSEIWHGTKLRELPQDLLTPMFRKGFKDFYVDELTELASGELVVPEMWIIRGGRMTADARRVRLTTVDMHRGLWLAWVLQFTVILTGRISGG